MTSIAHARREIKASAQEHKLSPAPESTWKTTFHEDCSQDTHEIKAGDATVSWVSKVQGGHRHWFSDEGVVKATWALTLVFVLGRAPPVLGRTTPDLVGPPSDDGYTILLVAWS